VSAYGDANFRLSSEFTAVAEEVALLTTNKGECQKCGRPLGRINNGNYESYAIRFRLTENETVVVCPDCDRELRNYSENEKTQTLEVKQSLELKAVAWDAVSRHSLDQNIREVLEAIHGMEASDDTRLKIEPLKVENKITENHLKRHVISDVTHLYEGVNSVLDRLSGENRLNVDRLARIIRRMFEDASGNLSSQREIYDMLVDSLFIKCGRKHMDECKVIVSYFVQRCEVFDEITK
jgi:hypothetical protein